MRARDKALPHMALKGGKLAGYGGLAEPSAVRRRADRPLLDDGHEGAQVLQIEWRVHGASICV